MTQRRRRFSPRENRFYPQKNLPLHVHKNLTTSKKGPENSRKKNRKISTKTKVAMRPSLTSCDAVERETEILQKWSKILSTTPAPGGLRGPKSR